MNNVMNVKGQYVLPSVMVENCIDPFTPLTADLMRMMLPGVEIIGGWPYVNLKYFLPILPLKLSESATICWLNPIPPTVKNRWCKLVLNLKRKFVRLTREATSSHLLKLLLDRTTKFVNEL